MKCIEVNGKNNRYWVKKLTEDSSSSGTTLLKNCKLNISADQIQYITEYSAELEKKLSNYKQQDKLKNRFDESAFISLDAVQKMLHESNLKCCYCSEDIFILYDIRREMNQWTLDRIDNLQGHNVGNVVISCLKCNLKKRSRDHQKFCDSTNVVVIKSQDLPTSNIQIPHSESTDEL